MYKQTPKEFQDCYPKWYPEFANYEENTERNNKNELCVKDVTFVVTEDCCLRCTYCYQHNKNSDHVMSKETARKIVDALFEADMNDNLYINQKNSQALIIEFIGGEPLLEIDLMDYIMHYFRWKAIQLNHRWAIHHSVNFTTNGVHFKDPRVQRFLWKNLGRTSFTITIDGNKDLHDSCRVFPDGSPSYDVVADAMHFSKQFQIDNETKLTLAPANIKYTFEAIKNLHDEFHLDGVHANCIYEEGWTPELGTVLYNEMKKTADWLLDGAQEEFYCSLFEEQIGTQIPESENDTYCWGKGTLILTKTGYKPIEEIQVGEMVYTHTGTLKPVYELHKHFADNVCKIKVFGASDSIVTKNHRLFVTPFESDSVEFLQIDEIQENDNIHLINTSLKYGHLISLEDVEPQDVYNITVADNHSYIANGMVSHNCGGAGAMISFTSDGHIQPCLRYTHFNLNDKQPEYNIGDLDNGIGLTPEYREQIRRLDAVTRRSQSTDECFYCPIGQGCGYCIALIYELYGDPNGRTTFICPMHKARVMANVYYWNKTYQKYGLKKSFPMNCPKEWALEIIDEDEYNMLVKLAEEQKENEI